jgi:PadR family transcriptional regulator PadR
MGCWLRRWTPWPRSGYCPPGRWCTWTPAIGIGGVGGRLRVWYLVPRSGFQLPWRLAFRRSCRGAGRGPLGEALLPFGRLGFQQRLGLAQPRQPPSLGGERLGQLVPTRPAVLEILALVVLSCMAQDLGDLDVEPVDGAVGLVGGIAGQLGAVQGDHADLDHAGGGAQLEQLHKEPGQGVLVADPEPRDGHVVGELVGGQHPESVVLMVAPFELAGRTDPKAVATEEHAEQELGVVGGMAVAVVPVGQIERLKIELIDHVEEEPGEMILGEPVAQVGWGQEWLVAVAAKEIVSHGPLSFSLRIFRMRCFLSVNWQHLRPASSLGLDYRSRPCTMRRMVPPKRESLITQMRRGTLEYCVLALLRHQARYGFDLVRTLADADGLITSEGTIYPLLSRLRRDGLVTTSWNESPSGPPRRYYQLTPAGHQALELFTTEWDRFTQAVDHLLEQGGSP